MLLFNSVVVPIHNPHAGRLHLTVAGLHAQNLEPSAWELVTVDNTSHDPYDFKSLDLSWHPHHRIVREEKFGLTAARLRGFSATAGDIIVLVDDDNVLAPDYLAVVAASFSSDDAPAPSVAAPIPNLKQILPGGRANSAVSSRSAIPATSLRAPSGARPCRANTRCVLRSAPITQSPIPGHQSAHAPTLLTP